MHLLIFLYTQARCKCLAHVTWPSTAPPPSSSLSQLIEDLSFKRFTTLQTIAFEKPSLTYIVALKIDHWKSKSLMLLVFKNACKKYSPTPFHMLFDPPHTNTQWFFTRNPTWFHFTNTVQSSSHKHSPVFLPVAWSHGCFCCCAFWSYVAHSVCTLCSVCPKSRRNFQGACSLVHLVWPECFAHKL